MAGWRKRTPLLWVMLLLAAALCLPGTASAGKANEDGIISVDEVSTAGGAESTTINTTGNRSGYLVVKTENEAATASLIVTVLAATDSGDFLTCTLTAITTNTTTVALLASVEGLTAADGITDVCIFPFTRRTKFTFTVTGASADFDVTADMEWIAD